MLCLFICYLSPKKNQIKMRYTLLSLKSKMYLILIRFVRERMVFQFQLCSIITEKRCWLHLGLDVSKENIISFTEETLRHCTTKKVIRDTTKKRKSKFDSIVLPENADGIAGYHASCYKYFCCKYRL